MTEFSLATLYFKARWLCYLLYYWN